MNYNADALISPIAHICSVKGGTHVFTCVSTVSQSGYYSAIGGCIACSPRLFDSCVRLFLFTHYILHARFPPGCGKAGYQRCQHL